MPDFFTEEIIHQATAEERQEAMQLLNGVYWPGITLNKGERLKLVKVIPAKIRPGQRTACACEKCGARVDAIGDTLVGEFDGAQWVIREHSCHSHSGVPLSAGFPPP